MVGAIAGDVVMHEKPVGRGYVSLSPTAEHPWRSGGDDVPVLHAHEFHYSSLDNLPAGTRFAYTMSRGHGIDGGRDGIVYKNLLASYTHLRSSAGCDWPAKFVRFARERRSQHNHWENHSCSR
jgi:cobyrinic acid a,c-diamide synthase